MATHQFTDPSYEEVHVTDIASVSCYASILRQKPGWEEEVKFLDDFMEKIGSRFKRTSGVILLRDIMDKKELEIHVDQWGRMHQKAAEQIPEWFSIIAERLHTAKTERTLPEIYWRKDLPACYAQYRRDYITFFREADAELANGDVEMGKRYPVPMDSLRPQAQAVDTRDSNSGGQWELFDMYESWRRRDPERRNTVSFSYFAEVVQYIEATIKPADLGTAMEDDNTEED